MVHVLIVEDSPTQAARLRGDLEAAGFRVTAARSGPEALEVLKTTSVDAVASDVVMPGMTGYELCRRIKDDAPHQDLPVLLLTSLTDPLEVVRGLESGADNFLRKPYDREQLLGRLRSAVTNRELRSSGQAQAGVRLSFLDREFEITADRQQVLDLLVSTFEDLVVTSRAVQQREQELEAARSELERQLHVAELERERLRAVVDAVPVPLFVTSPDGTVSNASQATASALQVNAGTMRGERLDEVVCFSNADGERVPGEWLPHRKAVELGEPVSRGQAFDLFVTCPDGKRLPVVLQSSPILDAARRCVGCVTTAHTLGGLTEYDSTTGLPNAATFLDRAGILVAGRHGRAGLLVLELDRFDLAQVSLTPATGHGVLAAVARRLRRLFDASGRPGSGSESFLAHLGGHRFGVLLTNLPDSFQLVHLAEAARRSIAGAGWGHDAGLALTASVGAAIDDGDQRGPELFAAASEALRNAQDRGGDTVEVFAPSAAKEAMERLQLEIDLRAAVERREITLHYQPEYDVTSGSLVGFEALARWRHPTLGPIPPAVFISLAEQTGLIAELGGQLLERACREASQWSSRSADARLSVSVNVSALQFRSELIDRVDHALAVSGLDAGCLVLEVTETASLSDPGTTIPVIEELSRRGVRFALDDFGTGYSSLTQLTRTRFDQLKLDRSFVTAIHLDGPDSIIARSVITLGRSLGIPVVAEGVETVEQLDELRALGCDMCQGYLFSRPIPDAEVDAFLDKPAGRPWFGSRSPS